jgi:hypothetical protein
MGGSWIVSITVSDPLGAAARSLLPRPRPAM